MMIMILTYGWLAVQVLPTRTTFMACHLTCALKHEKNWRYGEWLLSKVGCGILLCFLWENQCTSEGLEKSVNGCQGGQTSRCPMSECFPEPQDSQRSWAIKGTAKDYEKGTDTMVGWFDPGSSWVAVLDGRNDLSCPADLYLEGTVVSKFFANQCCYERKSSIFQCYYTWISTGWEKFRDEQIFGKCYISTHGDLRWKAIQVVCCKRWDFGFKSFQIFEEVGHHLAVKQRQWNRMMWLSLLRALKTMSLRCWRLEIPVSPEGVVWDGKSLPEGKVWLEATYQFQIQQSCILH